MKIAYSFFIVGATMTFKLLFILLAIVKIAKSQYYISPPSPYQQSYHYYSSAPPPMPSYVLFPPIPFAPQIPGYSTSTRPSAAVAPALKHPLPPSQPPYQPPFYPPPSYPVASPSYPPPRFPSTLPFPPFSTPRSHQKYPMTCRKNPNAAPNYAPMTAAPKCNPPTAIAYYLTTVPETPKAADLKEKVKENIREKPLPPPTYPCPFCTAFADVPKNSKVPPPPAATSVLPGILDKIPTIKLPEKLNLGNLNKMTTPSPPLLTDVLEKKLAGKLRFDEDLLDGFLTGLGLGKLQPPL